MSKSGKECKFVSDLVKGVNKLKSENSQIQSLINEINTDMTSLCAPTSKKGGKSRSMKGGDGAITALQMKRAIQTLIILLLGYIVSVPSAALTSILAGLTDLYSGQCRSTSNVIFGSLGFGNPVCQSYNRLIHTIYRGLNADLTAVPELLAYITLVTTIPYYTTYLIRISTYYIARALPRALVSHNELQILAEEA